MFIRLARPIVFLGLVLLASHPGLAEVGNNQHLLNPNQASREQLAALPHVSQELAARIHKAAPFLSTVALHDILQESLDAAACEEVYRHLFVPLNLNTAPRQEILLVPGVGKRMAHEFEEYRPYEAMARFRREIGKYVDDDEVARLEQYVYVPIELNTASDEDILSIPGVGKRMLHEFKEYRPYTSMKQFRREIGKYVDDQELARLERYVTLKVEQTVER